MKIIYDHQIFVKQRYGGISRYFYELAHQLSINNTAHAEIFAPLHINAYLQSEHMLRNACLPKFHGSTFTLDLIGKIAGLASIKHRSDIDIFHETYYTTSTYAPARAKRVLTVFDMIHERFPESFHDAEKAIRMKRSAVRNADHIICISENTRLDLIEILNIPKQITSVIHLGHSLTHAIINSHKYRLPHDTPYLLYVGNRSGYKNSNNLISAYSQSKELRKTYALVFFGGGNFSHEELKFIRYHGLPETSIMHVEGDDKMLSSMYAGATAFIYPSLYEGFGIPPLEAMAHGCPVLCSNTSSVPEVVGEAAKLFNPYDPSDISNTIEKALTSKRTLNSLIERGYERITQFSWEKCANETLATYRQLANGDIS